MMSEQNSTGKPKPSPPKKTRQFACISYLSEEQIHYCLQKKVQYIRHWAYILHDKDVKDDGSPKEPHYHILLWTYSPCNINTVRKWFSIEDAGNTLAQAVLSADDVVDYLTHDGSPDKYQYPESAVVSDDWEWFKRSANTEPSIQCLEDLLSGVSLYELARTYGREFIINSSKYIDLAHAIQGQRSREWEKDFEGDERIPAHNLPGFNGRIDPQLHDFYNGGKYK